jgi:hypothetical protein
MILDNAIGACSQCAGTLGLVGVFSGAKVIVPDSTPVASVAALQTWLVAPTALTADIPSKHNHVMSQNPVALANAEAWALLNAKLVALPPAPTPPAVDPYAAIRARLTAATVAALSAAGGAAGLV